MLKTILVPTSGSRTDACVFSTALAVGRAAAAHLEFLHVHITPGEAAVHAPHVEFARGPAISESLVNLRQRGHELAESALRHFTDLCATNGVEIRSAPAGGATPSASWCEETDHAMERLIFHARHADLTVVGRRRSTDYLATGLIESLLANCGRPIVIAPQGTPPATIDTIVVGWKEQPEAARALAAAMPLLEQAQRVILLSIVEARAASREALEHLAQELAWHGITAKINLADGGSHPATERLPQVVQELRPDLLVVGAFSHGPLRELMFGGITRTLIEQAEAPVLMMR